MKTQIIGSLIVLVAATAPALCETVKLRAASVEIVTTASTPQRKEFDIRLTPESSEKLFRFTSRHVGKIIDVSIAGKHIVSPRLNTPLFGPPLPMAGSGSEAEMETMKQQMLTSDAIELSSQEP